MKKLILKKDIVARIDNADMIQLRGGQAKGKYTDLATCINAGCPDYSLLQWTVVSIKSMSEII